MAFLFVGVNVVFLIMKKPKLKYFSASEFGLWWPLMSSDLLKKLDLYREKWGDVVEVSKHKDALGRTGVGGEDKSQHNVTLWGEVRAVDVFPKKNGQYITSLAERQRAYQIAREVGFTGIGIYTDTKLGNMLHLDVREGRTAQNPAQWSRVNQNYSGIMDVIA